MADANEDPVENRLLDLERAFDENLTQGRLVEAEEAELSIENILSVAADEVEIAMRRREQASDARGALVRWLEVLEVYLRINLSPEHGVQYGQLSRSQEPIGILMSALMDLDRGVVQWILKKAGCDQSPHAHDLRAVEFKVRCVVLADEIGDEQAYKLARDAAAGYGVKMSGKAQIKEWRRQMREQPRWGNGWAMPRFRGPWYRICDADKSAIDTVDLLLTGDRDILPASRSPKVG